MHSIVALDFAFFYLGTCPQADQVLVLYCLYL